MSNSLKSTHGGRQNTPSMLESSWGVGMLGFESKELVFDCSQKPFIDFGFEYKGGFRNHSWLYIC